MMRNHKGCGYRVLLPVRMHFFHIAQHTDSLLYILVLTALTVVLAGCSSAPYRYRARESGEKDTAVVTREQPPTEKEIREERKENDKPVDVTTVVLTLATVPSENPAIDNKKMLDEVLSMLGTPYAYSGNDDTGIDCSGFTCRVYNNAMNLKLPRTAREQFSYGSKVDDEQPTFGDLVFFSTKGNGPSHVGIYLSENLFAHASVSSGVTISSLESSYYKKRFLGVRRVVR